MAFGGLWAFVPWDRITEAFDEHVSELSRNQDSGLLHDLPSDYSMIGISSILHDANKTGKH